MAHSSGSLRISEHYSVTLSLNILRRYLTILYSLQTNSRDIFLLLMSNFIKQELKLSIEELTSKGLFINRYYRKENILRRAQLKAMVKDTLQQIDSHKLQSEAPFTQYEVILQAEALNKYTRVMRLFHTTVFYLVFIGGNAAYMVSESNQCDKNLQNVTFVLLLIGYIFSAFLIVGIGLAVLSMGLYIPVLFGMIMFGFMRRLMLQIRRYYKYRTLNHIITDGKSEHLTQCMICMYDYGIGDKPQRHNFHTECIMQWFEIKQQCPVCRKQI